MEETGDFLYRKLLGCSKGLANLLNVRHIRLVRKGKASFTKALVIYTDSLEYHLQFVSVGYPCKSEENTIRRPHSFILLLQPIEPLKQCTSRVILNYCILRSGKSSTLQILLTFNSEQPQTNGQPSYRLYLGERSLKSSEMSAHISIWYLALSHKTAVLQQ